MALTTHPPPSSAEVKERVQLYVYSTSGPSWPVIGGALPLPSKPQKKNLKKIPHTPFCKESKNFDKTSSRESFTLQFEKRRVKSKF